MLPAGYPGNIGADDAKNVMGYTDFALPADLICDGVTTSCILRSAWQTGNSCYGQGTPPQYQFHVTDVCTDPFNAEWFWQCANIM